ncbi:C1 family peptidase [Luteimonas sp. MC1572]|uniref:C1 family peptidase n=1 Tax=Luteimonas sp. MC1572 TaxID=2799325 RepID=UPI0018F0C993|nr:C1 family peptidase [Luteimonas sp. MC1572]MBJ6980925.1 C1 family peptidase [Luteimonas sp. MC1572]QQO02281.1 C1 family peptidase [Luteimonas sp. MC1572]
MATRRSTPRTAEGPVTATPPLAVLQPGTGTRLFDARPDTADFRDRMFEPTLVDVPTEAPLDDHLALGVPVLDQGVDGACTAFGLATVAHTLLRRRRPQPEAAQISARMFYDMARRYDEWDGEGYAGSSCRGAMKAWHRHGVCAEELWPYRPGIAIEPYTEERARDALRNPMGAYARVNHKDLVAMHAAFGEVRVLYASCAVHAGWQAPPKDGHIAWKRQEVIGYHAFAIVGYDRGGFWIQNAWGTGWGRGGFGRISYDEWLEHGTDVWVARLAVPVELERAGSAAVSNSLLGRQSVGYAQADLRPHIVSLGNNGALRCDGRFACTQDDVRNIVRRDMRAITAGWKKKRVLLYAHGGLVPEDAAIQRVADYREAMLAQEIYPLSFIWKTDLWTTLGNILKDAARPRSEGIVDKAKDLLLDRLDDTVEPLARAIGGRAVWDEMKENATLATTAVRAAPGGGVVEHGGAAQVARLVDEWRREDAKVEIHIAAHSAGSILMAPLLQLLTRPGQIIGGPAHGMLGMGGRVASVSLWAPAIDMDGFIQAYVPAISSRAVARASLTTLTDSAEQDDHCMRLYNKSLLYLVARALEKQPRSWIDQRLRQGTPIAGMARFIAAREPADQAWGHERVTKLIEAGRLAWVQAPNDRPLGDPGASRASTHGGFDDDPATLQALISFILGRATAPAGIALHRTSADMSARRERARDALSESST